MSFFFEVLSGDPEFNTIDSRYISRTLSGREVRLWQPFERKKSDSILSKYIDIKSDSKSASDSALFCLDGLLYIIRSDLFANKKKPLVIKH
ncbi:MAG: hypothetical protein GWN00_35300 [Aliifodinibius sp.]|nr:hypothetical protein [Fodinibius sp.]NIY29865.1 hypothetical protein [Fodinibius sp.]